MPRLMGGYGVVLRRGDGHTFHFLTILDLPADDVVVDGLMMLVVTNSALVSLAPLLSHVTSNSDAGLRYRRCLPIRQTHTSHQSR